MEPFEVLCDMLKSGDFNDVGGPPQLLKVYQHMNRTPIAVKWALGKKNYSSLLGRPLLDYERTAYPVIDPNDLTIAGGLTFGH